MTALVCWRCGASLDTISLPIERLAQCRQCNADLHVCRLCKFYNPRLSDKCDHDMAEPAREVDVANFCDYFRPRPGAHTASEKQQAEAARAQLESLFGAPDVLTPNDSNADSTEDKDKDDRARFDALFKKD